MLVGFVDWMLVRHLLHMWKWYAALQESPDVDVTFVDYYDLVTPSR